MESKAYNLVNYIIALLHYVNSVQRDVAMTTDTISVLCPDLQGISYCPFAEI